MTIAYECEDMRQKLNIEIVKEDRETGAKLAGAEFTLTDFWGRKVAAAVTDKNGVARFYDLAEGTYRAYESKAPDGYRVNTGFRPTFKLAYDADGAETLTWMEACADEKIPPTPATPAPKQTVRAPKTGDDSKPFLWLAICAAAAIAAAVSLIAMRKKKETDAYDEADEADGE
jgi:LPXTG-motif cell wall-anchored protein